jgi:hypothetical protein
MNADEETISSVFIRGLSKKNKKKRRTKMNFNFQGLANALALVSLGLAGAILAGSMLFPETAARYKRQIPDVIVGLILVASASYIIGTLGG